MAHFAEVLSFMRRRKPRGTGIEYWCVEPTGSYGNDCATGAKLATEYLEFVGKHPTVGHATLLNCIVSDIHKNAGTKGFSGIEVGFFRQINQFAMVAAQLWTGNLPKGGAA